MMFYCHHCDRMQDSDDSVAEKDIWNDDAMICQDCCEQKELPEDIGRWKITYEPPPISSRNHDWTAVHEDYDGAVDSHDYRAFTGPSIEDLLHQISDYNEDR